MYWNIEIWKYCALSVELCSSYQIKHRDQSYLLCGLYVTSMTDYSPLSLTSSPHFLTITSPCFPFSSSSLSSSSPSSSPSSPPSFFSSHLFVFVPIRYRTMSYRAHVLCPRENRTHAVHDTLRGDDCYMNKKYLKYSSMTASYKCILIICEATYSLCFPSVPVRHTKISTNFLSVSISHS